MEHYNRRVQLAREEVDERTFMARGKLCHGHKAGTVPQGGRSARPWNGVAGRRVGEGFSCYCDMVT